MSTIVNFIFGLVALSILFGIWLLIAFFAYEFYRNIKNNKK